MMQQSFWCMEFFWSAGSMPRHRFKWWWRSLLHKVGLGQFFGALVCFEPLKLMVRVEIRGILQIAFLALNHLHAEDSHRCHEAKKSPESRCRVNWNYGLWFAFVLCFAHVYRVWIETIPRSAVQDDVLQPFIAVSCLWAGRTIFSPVSTVARHTDMQTCRHSHHSQVRMVVS
jgi:hypothetical protein